MPGIEIKGRSKIANYRHGGRTGKFGGGRTNLLEQLGRVEAEPSNPNRRAEISRVHGELNRGYKDGGRIGLRHGSPHTGREVRKWISRPGKRPKMGKPSIGPGKTYLNPNWSEEKKIPSRLDSQRKNIRLKAEHASGLKKGGKVDKKWIQKAVNPKHKGYCTPMTKKTCTPARKALARTFKKKAKTGWG
jgi:hypothetical protein